MMPLIALLVVAAMLLVLVFVLESREASPPPDPEAEARAAVELHRIRRGLDVVFLKTEQRQDMSRLRRDIGRALDDSNGKL
jgi:hypothetical protein